MKPTVQPAYNSIRAGSCTVLIGTSGYSYTEWVDNGFYPPGTKSSEMLCHYAQQFQVVELNYTWYQMARADAMTRLLAKAPENFRFAAKLTRTLTHERDDRWASQLTQFKDGIAPLLPQLIAILVQFPPDFDRSIANRLYLAKLLDGLAGYPVAVEFRHISWAADAVFAELEKRKITLVCVDEPQIAGLFPALGIVTNPDFFYIRFHGRNTAGWRSTNMQKKFDYDYSTQELQNWYSTYLKDMLSQASGGIIFFNNHVRAQAPRNAATLARLMSRMQH